MIPATLSDVRAKVAAGEPVNWRQVATLQALDIAIIGEQFAQESIERERNADTDFERQLAAALGE